MNIKKVFFMTSFMGALALSACGESPHVHTWGDITYTWSSDYSTCTAKRVCTIDESHVEEETVNSTYQITTPETVTADGEGEYVATFTNSDFATQTHTVSITKDLYAQRPHFGSSYKQVYYGLYPQTVVNDSDIIAALNNLTSPESNGWYLYNGVYYAKHEGLPYDSDHTFDNGDTIVIGQEYWFECQPIEWKVLSNTDNQYYLLSTMLLNSKAFHSSRAERTIDGKTIYPNNYMYSDIRAWLNGEFFNSAFALGNSNIQLTTVDNSAATTANATNEYACDDTEDRVFLPSYQDYMNTSYGFIFPDYRRSATTDFARACGVRVYTNSNFGEYHWTRSPYAEYAEHVKNIYFNGSFSDSGNRVDFVYNGVRPAIVVTIDK